MPTFPDKTGKFEFFYAAPEAADWRCNMIAGVLLAPGKVEITEFPEPPMGEDCVKVAVAWCGLCGTDFHKFAGKAGSRPVTYPVPLGHEISGVVAEVGPKVTGFKVGDRVTVDPNWSCGHCYYCQDGKRHLCENSRGVVKGMATYICPPVENVYHIPDSLSLREAALTEPLGCCLHGMDLMDVRLGETVAIVGMGAIGSLMLQLCAHSAAGQIIIVEPEESKRELAMKMGASLFINPKEEDPKEAIARAGIRVDKVMECGGIPATIETALDIAGRGATVVLFGVAAPEARVVIKTSYINPGTTRRAIDLLACGAIDTSLAISKQLELEELPEEMATRRFSRLGKVLVRVDKNTKD